MPTTKEIRRIRLAELVAELGGQAKVAALADKDRRQVSAWLADPEKKGAKGIRDDTARELEIACGKPIGWLDRLNDSDHETPNKQSPEVGGASHPVTLHGEMLAEAEQWVRFEEGAGVHYQAMERWNRIAALYDQIAQDGGRLSPEHCEALISAARLRQTKGKGKDDGTDDDPGGKR